MKQSIFVAFMMVITTAIVQVYAYFKYYYSGVSQAKVVIEHLTDELEREKFKSQIQAYEFREFQQSVATLIPQVKNKLEKHQETKNEVRQIASLVTAPKTEITLELSSTLFEKGREEFRKGEFKNSNQIFSDLIEKHPFSKHLIEAHFLLAEGQYMMRDFSGCLQTIDFMLTHYPDEDTTGFMLVRMGQILESRERKQDAAEVYYGIINTYSNPKLRSYAQKMLKGLGL